MRMCSARRPVAINQVCVSNISRNDPISTACICSTAGNGGRAPARTIPTFMIESGMNPASVIAMNHAAMNTKIHRSIACARGVPDKASGALLFS